MEATFEVRLWRESEFGERKMKLVIPRPTGGEEEEGLVKLGKKMRIPADAVVGVEASPRLVPSMYRVNLRYKERASVFGLVLESGDAVVLAAEGAEAAGAAVVALGAWLGAAGEVEVSTMDEAEVDDLLGSESSYEEEAVWVDAAGFEVREEDATSGAYRLSDALHVEPVVRPAGVYHHDTDPLPVVEVEYVPGPDRVQDVAVWVDEDGRVVPYDAVAQAEVDGSALVDRCALITPDGVAIHVPTPEYHPTTEVEDVLVEHAALLLDDIAGIDGLGQSALRVKVRVVNDLLWSELVLPSALTYQDALKAFTSALRIDGALPITQDLAGVGLLIMGESKPRPLDPYEWIYPAVGDRYVVGTKPSV